MTGALLLRLTEPELEMLRHALRIAAEDGSLFSEYKGEPAAKRFAWNLRTKIDAALAKAKQP
jgi:hypothetical protein